jgi:hypothetical protein
MDPELKVGARVVSKVVSAEGVVIAFDRSGEYPRVLVRLDDDEPGRVVKYDPAVLSVVRRMPQTMQPMA